MPFGALLLRASSEGPSFNKRTFIARRGVEGF